LETDCEVFGCADYLGELVRDKLKLLGELLDRRTFSKLDCFNEGIAELRSKVIGGFNLYVVISNGN
jgi:hypothetical protein